MKTTRQVKTPESGSVKFHFIGAVEFWFTAVNRVFLLVNGEPIFPSLQGGSIVRYDVPGFKASPEVEAKLIEVLRKQRDIRANWAPPEEDEIAFQYS